MDDFWNEISKLMILNGRNLKSNSYHQDSVKSDKSNQLLARLHCIYEVCYGSIDPRPIDDYSAKYVMSFNHDGYYISVEYDYVHHSATIKMKDESSMVEYWYNIYRGMSAEFDIDESYENDKSFVELLDYLNNEAFVDLIKRYQKFYL